MVFIFQFNVLSGLVIIFGLTIGLCVYFYVITILF